MVRNQAQRSKAAKVRQIIEENQFSGCGLSSPVSDEILVSPEAERSC
jgi:hypothetical protein